MSLVTQIQSVITSIGAAIKSDRLRLTSLESDRTVLQSGISTPSVPGVNLLTGLITTNYKDVSITFAGSGFASVPRHINPVLKSASGANGSAVLKGTATKTSCVVRVANFEATAQVFILDLIIII